MWCVICNHDLVDCTCPDIEERMKGLYSSPVGPAVLQNMASRKAKQQFEQMPTDKERVH